MMAKRIVSRLLFSVAMAAMLSLSAHGAMVTYHTVGTDFLVNGVPQESSTLDFGDVRIQYNPVASATVEANPLVFVSLGEIVISGVNGNNFPATALPAGIGLRLKISQTLPDVVSGFLPDATIFGTISGSVSTGALEFPTLRTITLGSLPLNYLPLESHISLLPPQTLGGVTPIVGVITSVPEPSSAWLLAAGGLWFVRRRSRQG